MSDEPDKGGTELIETGSGLKVLVRRPVPTDEPHPALIMIHGWGANEGDIYELVPFVDRRVLIIAPRGPHLASDDPRGSFFWYNRAVMNKGQDATYKTSVEKLGQLLDELDGLGGVAVNRQQVYAGGFSQGGVMSLAMAAHFPDRLAGILPHSSSVTPTDAERLRSGVFRGKGAFVAHGTLDMVLQVKHGQTIKAVLEEGGVDLTYREYPIAHSTSPQSRQDLAQWLNGRLV